MSGGRLRTLYTVTAVAIVTGAGSSPAQEWNGRIEERDGVTHVQNPREGLWQGLETAPIRFELEQTFGADTEPADEILGAIGLHGVAVDGDGNVYVYDYTAKQIVAFGADGTLRWRGGRPGQGPGEFDSAEGLAWTGGSTLYIGNLSANRIEEWSTAGDHVASNTLADRGLPNGSLLGLLDPTTLALETFSPAAQAGGRLGVIDVGAEWRALAEVDIDVADGDLGRNRAFVSMDASGGMVTVGDIDSYELRFFNRDGRLTRVVSRDFDPMVGYARSGERGTLYSWLGAPVQLASEHWVVNSSWVDVDDADADYAVRLANDTLDDRPWRASIDLFDPDGRFLYALESDERPHPVGSIVHVGPEGKVYASIRDPYPHIRRYRVSIEE